MKPEDNNQQNLLTEYSAAHDAYIHYDNFTWQVGGVLIAGVFIFWGFIARVDPPDSLLFDACSILVSIVMSVWILYADHNRQIYKQKIDRLCEIERIFEFRQHIGWKKKSDSKNPQYKTYGPKGHSLDYFVYFFSCSIGPILGWIKVDFSFWSIVPIGMSLAVLIWIQHNQQSLEKHRDKINQGNSPHYVSQNRKVSYAEVKMTEADNNASHRDATQTEDARTGYQAAVDLWTYEGEQNWARFNVMLVANSIIIAVLGLTLTSQERLASMSIVLSIVGLILCAAWFVITKRGFDYQNYYVMSARELEERFLSNVIETASRGGTFAQGCPVSIQIDGKPKTLRMSRWSRIASAGRVSLIVVLVFAAVYVLSLLWAIDELIP